MKLRKVWTVEGALGSVTLLRSATDKLATFVKKYFSFLCKSKTYLSVPLRDWLITDDVIIIWKSAPYSKRALAILIYVLANILVGNCSILPFCNSGSCLNLCID